MSYIKISNENPDLRKQLGDFVIQFSTIEAYLTDLTYRFENLSGRIISYNEMAKKDLSVKRKIIKEFVEDELPALEDEWISLNKIIGDINNERKVLIHSISVFNIQSNEFVSKLKENNKFKRYSSDNIKDLNERIDDLIFGSKVIATHFYIKVFEELKIKAST